MTGHHVRCENVAGWSGWVCDDCDWATPLTLYPVPWDEQAARKHASDMDPEADP